LSDSKQASSALSESVNPKEKNERKFSKENFIMPIKRVSSADKHEILLQHAEKVIGC